MISETIHSMILLKRFNGKTFIPTPEVFGFSFPKSIHCLNFADYSTEYKFKSIVGIIPCNKIDKCIDHMDSKAELIIHTHSSFISKKKLYQLGTITDILRLEDNVILRFAKDDFSHQTLIDGKWHNCSIENIYLYFALPS